MDPFTPWDEKSAPMSQRCTVCGCQWRDSHTCPAPGSESAGKAGCLCPVLDNCHGRWSPLGDDIWVIRDGCPVHNPTAA